MEITLGQYSAITASLVISYITWHRWAYKAYLGFVHNKSSIEAEFVTRFSSIEERYQEILRNSMLRPHPLDQKPKPLIVRQLENYRIQVLRSLIIVNLRLVQHDQEIHLGASGDFSKLNHVYLSIMQIIIFCVFPIIFGSAAFLSYLSFGNDDIGWIWKLPLIQLGQIGFVVYLVEAVGGSYYQRWFPGTNLVGAWGEWVCARDSLPMGRE